MLTGRARAKNATYKLLGNAGTAEKDRFNRMCEQMQEQAICAINEMSEQVFMAHIDKHQKDADIERQMHNTEVEAKKRMRNVLRRSGKDYVFRCYKCDAFAVLSDDIGVVSRAHHVVKDCEFELDRVIIEPIPKPEKYGEWEQTSKIFCKKCKSYWGTRVLYKNIPFSIIKLEGFVVSTPHGDRQRYKQWKECPFYLEPISAKELEKRALLEIEYAVEE